MACDYEINDNRFDFERSVANVCQNMIGLCHWINLKSRLAAENLMSDKLST